MMESRVQQQGDPERARIVQRRHVAEAAVRAAGAVHIRHRKHRIDYQTKNDNLRDLVTAADLEGQAAAEAIIQAAFPGEPIIGEEDGATLEQQAALMDTGGWLIDPLDGTFLFAHGFPDFSATVAYVEAGRPVAGAVYAPALDEMFSAGRNLGASLNGTPIAVSSRKGLDKSIVNVWLGRRVSDQQRAREAELSKRVFAQISFGGTALKLAYVACGRYDLHYMGPRNGPWDIAAGALLVDEAGGVVTMADGAPFVLPTMTMAAGADRATLDELLAFLAK
jgi:myo-inositol-1(or 4)-monophosphatase